MRRPRKTRYPIPGDSLCLHDCSLEFCTSLSFSVLINYKTVYSRRSAKTRTRAVARVDFRIARTIRNRDVLTDQLLTLYAAAYLLLFSCSVKRILINFITTLNR